MTKHQLLFREFLLPLWIKSIFADQISLRRICDVGRIYFFDAQSMSQRERESDAQLDDESRMDDWLFCAACKTKIVHVGERIKMLGVHSHRFTNPQGYSFHITCFRSAPGCVPIGEKTLEHTWFPGHSWQIAICIQCQTHLGWGFNGSGSNFYGIIVDQLVAHQKD